MFILFGGETKAKHNQFCSFFLLSILLPWSSVCPSTYRSCHIEGLASTFTFIHFTEDASDVHTLFSLKEAMMFILY